VISDVVISEDGGTLFAASGDQDRLVAYDAATGAQRWRGDMYEEGLKPAVANGLVYTVLRDGLRVYDAEGCGATTCTPLWTATFPPVPDPPDPPLPGAPLHPIPQTEPTVAGDVLYIGTRASWLGAEAIYAFPAAGCGSSTCAPIWSAALDGVPLAVTVALGRVYVVTYDGLTAFGPST